MGRFNEYLEQVFIYNEGLQNHVNRVLIEAEPEFEGKLYWNKDGLHIQGSQSLKDIAIDILEKSDEFGPVHMKKNGAITFGIYKDYFKGDYDSYKKKFKESGDK